MTEPAGARVDVLGVGVDPVTRAELFEAVARWVRGTAAPAIVAYANVHVVDQAVDDPDLRAFLASADLVYCDGNGVRLGARMLGHDLPERMTGADWIWDLAGLAEREGWRLYWIGGEDGLADEAATALRARYPKLDIGTDHGYHARTGAADEAVLDRIHSFHPHVLLVGMGTPEQERWVAARRDRLHVPVVWCVGGLAAFASGRTRRGPRWITDRAEWADRLLAEPGRLWRRYLLGNARFLWRIAARRARADR